MRDKPSIKSISPEAAETLAIKLLRWLVTEPDLLGRFLSLTGVEPTEVRQAIKDPDFLAGLLDFIMQHEPDLMAFCSGTATKPEDVAAAWRHFVKPGLESGDY